MELEEAIIHAKRGEAILFTGAGFSYKATNSLAAPNNEVPSARAFATHLSLLSDAKGSYDLPIISQHFMKKKGEYQLLNEISRNFTITSVKPYHVEIGRLPWRRVYTTNYDNCFEFAATQTGKEWIPLTLDSAPSATAERCVHINGHISNLTIKNLNSQIKLTHSSYSADAFSSSKWSQQLRQDFNNAKAVIFIGYSMSDIDISRLLFASPALRARTHFIVAPGEDDILVSPLEPYGDVHKIGVQEFGTLVSTTAIPKDASSDYQYSWLIKYDSREAAKPDDKAGIDLLTLGIINSEYVAWAMGEPHLSYIVPRSEVHEIQREIERGRTWFLIHSDLGNGKTALKFQLSHILSKFDYKVYWDTDFDLNKKSDIRNLGREDGKLAVFIDETPDRFDVIDGLLELNLKNIVVFVCVRTTLYELGQSRYEDYLPENYLPIDANLLGDADVVGFVNLLNTLGLWGDRAGDSEDAKENFLKVACDRRIARLILSVFENSDIGARIVSSAKSIVNDRSSLGSLVILCFLMNRIGHPPRPNVMSEILDADVWKIAKSEEFNRAGEFIRYRDGAITSRSSIISSYLLRRAATPESLIWNIEKFVRRLAGIKRDTVLHHIFTELQRFPMLESVIESPRKRELIIGYFQAIKDIPFCQKNGLFWLHYAMARLSYGEFKEATLYFEHARSLAKDSPKDLIDINNHYARLLIDSRTKSDEYDDYFAALEMAHGILISQINRATNKHFPFRQAKKYVEFISFRKNKLTASQLKQFVTYCKQIDSAIEHLTGAMSRTSEVLACKEAMGRAIRIAGE
jgi:SIR2-like domain